MNTVIWAAQIILALVFLMAGLMKLAQPREKLAEAGMGWTEDFADGQIKAIGVVELLAAIGLVVPAALDIAPQLTAYAAAGLVLVMVGAAITHIRRKEIPMVVVNAALGGIALFVAIERFGSYSF